MGNKLKQKCFTDDSKFEFLIGNGTCEEDVNFCNKPLNSNTEYYLKVRGLTNIGFRDTPPIKFLTRECFCYPIAHLDKFFLQVIRTFQIIEFCFFFNIIAAVIDDSISLSVILGIVFGIIGAALILVLIFIFWRRKQKKANFKTQDIIPLMPIPISAFPKHCFDYKTNFNKLKAEYALIGSRSAEEAPTSYTAMLPHNKKKNRYTNILPCKLFF